MYAVKFIQEFCDFANSIEYSVNGAAAKKKSNYIATEYFTGIKNKFTISNTLFE